MGWTAGRRCGSFRRADAPGDGMNDAMTGAMSALRDLRPLLRPRSVAVVGATPDANRIGGRPFAFLRRFGFPGPVHPVNPRHREIDGAPCYARVADIPEPPDMAVIAIPAAGVLDSLRDCQAAGVPAVTIYTSGFRETGDAGEALEAELKALAEREGTLVCGPNCQGVTNLLDKVQANFNSALADPGLRPGPVGFVSQSGLFTGILAAALKERDLGVGYMVSTGNEAVVDFADVLAFMARDERIRVVAGYLEGVRDGRKLAAAVRAAHEHGKPVVLLKVGRNAASAAAAASHTGALAGAYDVYRAALAQWGVVEVDTIDELLDAVEAFAVCEGTAAGDRVGILTNSGGLGVFGADRLQARSLRLAELGEATVAAIEEKLFDFASATNPVDFTLQALTDASAVGSHLAHIVRDENVDVTLAFFGVQKLNVPELVDAMDAANRLNDKPLIVAWMHGHPDGPRMLRERGIPCLRDPASAVTAASALVSQARGRRRQEGARAPRPVAALAEAVSGVLSEWRSREFLAAAGIPMAAGALAADADAAVAAADKLGYPVVLKVDSADIAHKTESGAVAVGLGDADAVRRAFAEIVGNARRAAPRADIAGCGVYATAPDGVELIAGIVRDPVFGPVVLVGMGGVFAEVLEDTALGLPPLDAGSARAMIEGLRGYPLLSGVRGRAAVDAAAAANALLALSDLALACPDIAELDINPLRVSADGALALDALVRVDPLPASGGRKSAP